MKVNVRKLVGWNEALNSARVTVWRDKLDKEPSKKFKYETIISEHSHLRELLFAVEIEGVKSWVITHFVRHHIGIEKYVATQRQDRNENIVSRDDTPQGNLVNARFTLNAQAFISISQRRLCHGASKETRELWFKIVSKLRKIEPELAFFCVPQCVYRGFCSERKETLEACKLNFEEWRNTYLDKIEEVHHA